MSDIEPLIHAYMREPYIRARGLEERIECVMNLKKYSPTLAILSMGMVIDKG